MKPKDEIIINGEVYQIDLKAREFKHEASLFNIPFSALEDHNGWYSLMLNTGTGLPVKLGDGVSKSLVKKITIPAHLLQNKHEKSIDYKHSLNKLSHLHNWGIALIDDQIKLRLDNKLPTVNIAGHMYSYDIEHSRLMDQENKRNSIPFGKLETSFGKDGIIHRLYYNTQTRSVEQEPFNANMENVYRIVLPGEKVIDPIGYSRKMGDSDFKLVSSYRITDHHIADAVPLNKVIELNRTLMYNGGSQVIEMESQYGKTKTAVANVKALEPHDLSSETRRQERRAIRS